MTKTKENFTAGNVIKEDYKLLVLCLDLGGYIGLTPSPVNFTGLNKAKLKEISQIILHVLLAIYACVSWKLQWEIITTSFNSMFRTLEISTSAIGVSYVFWSSAYLSLICRNDWARLLSKMQQLEHEMAASKAGGSHHVLLARVVSIYSFLFLFHTTRECVWYSNQAFNRIGAFSFTFITHFYLTSLLVQHVVFSDWLANRYETLNEELSRWGRTPHRLGTKLEDFTKVHKLAGALVVAHNRIFDSLNFVQVSVYVVFILNTFAYSVDGHQSTMGRKILDLVQPLFHSVSLLLFTEACDAVEKSGRRIVRTCYCLHKSIQGDALLKEEVKVLARYAEERRPVFWFWNFFHLNRSSLLTFFSAIITYTVIVIQFNLSGKKKIVFNSGNATLI